MLDQSLHQPLDNVLQSQRDIWPDPEIVRNKPQLLEEASMYSSSCRTPPIGPLPVTTDNHNGLIFGSKPNKATFTQCFKNKFNQTPNGDALSRSPRILFFSFNENSFLGYLFRNDRSLFYVS